MSLEEFIKQMRALNAEDWALGRLIIDNRHIPIDDKPYVFDEVMGRIKQIRIERKELKRRFRESNPL